MNTYTPAHPVDTSGIPADLHDHPGRRTIIDYLQQHMDHGEYFISESADGERGVLTYRLTLHKGSYTPGGVCSYSLFDSIHLISEKARVSRATQKQLREHVQKIYDNADSRIQLLEAAGDQWRAQKRQPGQVRYYADTYELYIGAGYMVRVNFSTKAETVHKIAEYYQPNELGAPHGDIWTGYKYQEYHKDIDMQDMYNRYKSTPTAELDRLITERKERERKAEEERRAEYAREQAEKKRAEEEARAKVNNGGSKYMLLQYNYVDNSDCMTDYFSNRLDTVNVLTETDEPIRTTFAGGRMDIWRLMRAHGHHVDNLKYKGYGGLMSLQNTKYTGHGDYTRIVFAEREKVMQDSYTVAALARGQRETVTA